MHKQTPCSGRHFGRALATTVSAAALFAAASLYAESPSSTPSTTTNPTGYEAINPSSSSISDPIKVPASEAASNSSSMLSRGDKRFVTKASELNNEEVRLSELAAQQATNPEVRSYAQQLVTEHTQAGTELSSIASSKGLVADPTDYDQRAATKLSKKTGKDFDKAYLDKMADAHEDAIDLFEKAAKNAKDRDVQAFAAKQLPTLKEHQDHAKSLEKIVK